MAEPCSGTQILAGKDLLWQGNLPQSLKLFTRDELEEALLQGSPARDGEAEGAGKLCLEVPDPCQRHRLLTGQTLTPVRWVTESLIGIALNVRTKHASFCFAQLSQQL